MLQKNKVIKIRPKKLKVKTLKKLKKLQNAHNKVIKRFKKDML